MQVSLFLLMFHCINSPYCTLKLKLNKINHQSIKLSKPIPKILDFSPKSVLTFSQAAFCCGVLMLNFPPRPRPASNFLAPKSKGILQTDQQIHRYIRLMDRKWNAFFNQAITIKFLQYSKLFQALIYSCFTKYIIQCVLFSLS